MIDVKINQQAYNRMIATLESLINKIQDMRPIWKDFAIWYPQNIVKVAFDSKGKVFGERWASYSPKYLKWKQKKYSGKPMLVQTGELKKAAENPKVKYDNFNMTLTVDNDLAGVHQFGSRRGIPARPFFTTKEKVIPKRAILYLLKAMNNYILEHKNG